MLQIYFRYVDSLNKPIFPRCYLSVRNRIHPEVTTDVSKSLHEWGCIGYPGWAWGQGLTNWCTEICQEEDAKWIEGFLGSEQGDSNMFLQIFYSPFITRNAKIFYRHFTNLLHGMFCILMYFV